MSENIYQKLAHIRKPVEVITKNKKGYGYTYASEDAILEKITGLMAKHNVSLIPSIVPGTTCVQPYSYTQKKPDKSGNMFEQTVNDILVQGEMVWTWINNEDPNDKIEVPWVFVGQQSDASQAFGSGLTYSSRYFLLKYFNVATPDDDPDSWRTRQKDAENLENKEIAKAIIDEVNTFVNTYLLEKPEAKADITKIVQSYVKIAGGKGSNYYSIENPETARKLYDELINKYGTKEN